MHCSDNRAADNDVRAYYGNIRCVELAGDYTLYMEGIQCEGGVRPMYAHNTAAGQTPKFYTKNCSFKYGKQDNALHVLGVNCYLQNCIAAYGFNDGFNYHAYNGVIPKVIEVNCVGRNNGINDGIDINNGSTMHDGGKIIRVNDACFNNIGGNIADINPGTQSWSMGCVAFKSTAETDLTHNSNFISHSGAENWNDGCYSYGSVNALTVEDASIMHIRNCRMEGGQVIEDTGQLVDY